jgi:hypothetical protein
MTRRGVAAVHHRVHAGQLAGLRIVDGHDAAWACGLRSAFARSKPRISTSSANAALPFTSRTASILCSGLATTAVLATSAMASRHCVIGDPARQGR